MKERKVKVSDEIWVNKFDEESAQQFREELVEATKGDPMRPVVIYIDSYGGLVDALAAMIETMDSVPNPLVTVCQGKAMSCGAILLSHGDIRFCGRHSRVMVHEVSGGTGGDVHDMYADAIETKRLNRYFMGLLAKNCNIKGGYEAMRKLIKEQDGRDRYMDAAAAVEFGLVDAIGAPQITQRALYDISLIPPKKKLLEKAQKPTASKKTTKNKKKVK